MYEFFKDTLEQPKYFSDISVHKTEEITAKACEVHRDIVLLQEGVKRKDECVTDFDTDVCVGHYMNFMTRGNILQHQSRERLWRRK